MNGFIICIPHGTQADQIKDEMGEACSTHGRGAINTKFWSENRKGRDHSKTQK